MKNENDSVGESGTENPKVVAPQAINVQPPASDSGATGGPKSEGGECGGVPPAETRAGTSQRDVPTSVPAIKRKRRKSINPMRKLREDSLWNRLTPAQREKLERLLFDQNMSYAQIVARVESEFGIETTMTSLCRFYHRRVRERQALGLMEAQFTANGLNNLKVDTDSLRAAALKLVGKAALSVTSDKPEEIEQLASLTEVLLEAEQNDLRRARLQFEQRCFDYEATLATVKEIPRVRAYLQAIADDKSLSSDEATRKVQDLLYHWANEVKAGKVK